ncbi:hypothetical protein EDD85DRAFT_962265 [Armillaria nabsnona]|nr:hypothetical protein EDD85DRAFT_962265 [Armillaria nabsnona]
MARIREDLSPMFGGDHQHHEEQARGTMTAGARQHHLDVIDLWQGPTDALIT